MTMTMTMTVTVTQQMVLSIENLQPRCVPLHLSMLDIVGCRLAGALCYRFRNDLILIAVTESKESDARVRDTFAAVDDSFKNRCKLRRLERY